MVSFNILYNAQTPPVTNANPPNTIAIGPNAVAHIVAKPAFNPANPAFIVDILNTVLNKFGINSVISFLEYSPIFTAPDFNEAPALFNAVEYVLVAVAAAYFAGKDATNCLM